MDNDYAQLIGDIEQIRVEEATRARKEQQNRDDMAYRLMAEFPNVEF